MQWLVEVGVPSLASNGGIAEEPCPLSSLLCARVRSWLQPHCSSTLPRDQYFFPHSLLGVHQTTPLKSPRPDLCLDPVYQETEPKTPRQ